MPTIQKGYDLFVTEGDAYFTLPDGFGVPADFFQKGSAPFSGIIRFEGQPLRKFTDHSHKEHKIGETDTVMYREQDVNIAGATGSGTTKIQLVALSLRSCHPIQVHTAHGVQNWDVYVSVSKTKPSVGSMTITQTSEQGGHFASELTIVPSFRFERRADGEERTLDIGALRIPAETQALVARVTTLQAANVAYTTAAPAGTLTVAAVTTNFAVARIAHHSHTVIQVRAVA